MTRPLGHVIGCLLFFTALGRALEFSSQQPSIAVHPAIKPQWSSAERKAFGFIDQGRLLGLSTREGVGLYGPGGRWALLTRDQHLHLLQKSSASTEMLPRRRYPTLDGGIPTQLKPGEYHFISVRAKARFLASTKMLIVHRQVLEQLVTRVLIFSLYFLRRHDEFSIAIPLWRSLVVDIVLMTGIRSAFHNVSWTFRGWLGGAVETTLDEGHRGQSKRRDTIPRTKQKAFLFSPSVVVPSLCFWGSSAAAFYARTSISTSFQAKKPGAISQIHQGSFYAGDIEPLGTTESEHKAERSYKRKRDKVEDKERIEEMVRLREVGRAGQLEKRVKREGDRGFQEKGDEGLEINESTLLGGGDSFKDYIRKRDEEKREDNPKTPRIRRPGLLCLHNSTTRILRIMSRVCKPLTIAHLFLFLIILFHRYPPRPSMTPPSQPHLSTFNSSPNSSRAAVMARQSASFSALKKILQRPRPLQTPSVDAEWWIEGVRDGD
ncbi:hypothetical protein C8J56DRAFT_1075994 [Mycena floridula]|nr:hypothetical protein C8J56DRAFT_1075994 [Mycena floridula]